MTFNILYPECTKNPYSTGLRRTEFTPLTLDLLSLLNEFQCVIQHSDLNRQFVKVSKMRTVRRTIHNSNENHTFSSVGSCLVLPRNDTYDSTSTRIPCHFRTSSVRPHHALPKDLLLNGLSSKLRTHVINPLPRPVSGADCFLCHTRFDVTELFRTIQIPWWSPSPAVLGSHQYYTFFSLRPLRPIPVYHGRIGHTGRLVIPKSGLPFPLIDSLEFVPNSRTGTPLYLVEKVTQPVFPSFLIHNHTLTLC